MKKNMGRNGEKDENGKKALGENSDENGKRLLITITCWVLMTFVESRVAEKSLNEESENKIKQMQSEN